MFLGLVKQESLIDLILTNTHTFLLWQSETGSDHLGALSRTHATPMPPLGLSTKLIFPHPTYIVCDMYVHLQPFHQVVSERQPHNADDLALTNEDLRDERNDNTRSQYPRKGRAQSCAAQPDSRMCMIRTRACSA